MAEVWVKVSVVFSSPKCFYSNSIFQGLPVRVEYRFHDDKHNPSWPPGQLGCISASHGSPRSQAAPAARRDCIFIDCGAPRPTAQEGNERCCLIWASQHQMTLQMTDRRVSGIRRRSIIKKNVKQWTSTCAVSTVNLVQVTDRRWTEMIKNGNGAYAEFLNKNGAGVHLPLKSMQVRIGEFPYLGGLLHCPPYLAAIFA